MSETVQTPPSNPNQAARQAAGERTVPDRPGLSRRLGAPILLGVVTVALAFGGFGYWALTAPISGAAVTQGTVGPENARQVVQHLEGGVVSEIAVRDGQTVEAGETILVLDDTRARAQLDAQTAIHQSLEARMARLTAEMKAYTARDVAGAAPFVFPEPLVEAARTMPSTAEILRVERARYEGRIESQASSVEIYDGMLEGYRREIAGLESEIAAIDRQLKLLGEEAELYAGLRKRGLETQSKVLQAQRNIAQSEQLRAEREARIVKLRSAIETDTLKRDALWVTRIDETSAELTSVSQELLTSAESLRSYRDVLSRTVVRAPVDGTLIALNVNTQGGVVAAGATIVEIVPSRDALTIEARVQPNDIDIVQAGQSASVSLLAYPQRNLPRIGGRVTAVSADSLVDSEGESYYVAKIELSQEDIDRLDRDIRVVPGMSVQAMITTNPRTFYDYIITPVLASAQRAFKEQ